MSLSVFHWGAARPRIEAGRVQGLAPFETDRHPSALLAGTHESLYSELRIRQPMVRASWLERVAGADHRLRRGVDGYVAVSWSEALELAAQAIRGTISRRGNRAIYAGSYGWASAGRFHHAPSLLHRLLNCVGGSVQHVQTYSYAAAQTICPHVVGSNDCVFGGTSTTWPSIAAHTERMFYFGGVNLRNAQVNAGGVLTHETAERMQAVARKPGFRAYSISPIRDDAPAFLDATWVPIRPGTDTALMLGIAHILISEAWVDQTFLGSHTVGYERLRDHIPGPGRQRPQDAALGSGNHRHSGCDDSRDGAADGAASQPLDRELVAAARRAWRAAVLDDDRAGRHAGPGRPAGRRRLLWLRLDRQPRRAAQPVRRAAHGRRREPGRPAHPGGARGRHAAGAGQDGAV